MKTHEKLTGYSRFSGCGAKLGPGILDKALCGLSQPDYDFLIADYSTSEDCGVIKISEQQALVQTIDFFPPIVDEPWSYGRIAGANALSDIYAMGADPVSAVSVVCFPVNQLSLDYLKEIMAGGLSALAEAGAALVGGHSIDDNELKFGFSINGLIHPHHILRNNSPKLNEAVILTKPIGTGAINTALRADLVSENALSASIVSMQTLNKKASEICRNFSVSACTDVTGFGLLGHAAEIFSDAPAGLHIDSKDIPLLPDAYTYIQMGLVPEGTYRNMDFRGHIIDNFSNINEDLLHLLFDPQTSGGLLFTVAENESDKIIKTMKEEGINAAVIGKTTSNRGRISID